jgi:hypothetical protein
MTRVSWCALSNAGLRNAAPVVAGPSRQVEFFERATSQQGSPVPCGPERDLRRPQRIEIQGMHALRR